MGSQKAILLAAFGAGSPRGEQTLKLFDAKVREVFPGLPVRWAFTSGLIRDRLARARKKSDSVKKALCRLAFERYADVAVQSLHIIPGAEYQELLAEVDEAGQSGGPARVRVGAPLLDEASAGRAARALLAHLPAERRAGEAVICMGHGTWHGGRQGYARFAAELRAVDPRIFVGTLSGDFYLERILEELDPSGRPRIWLVPLLSVIGRHAEHDMAGPHPESWKSRLEAAGFECRPVLRGTAEYAGFIDIWLDHLRAVL